MSQIGIGSKVEINDGTADAFVEVTNVTSLGVPDFTLGTTESKRLNITNNTVRKVPTMLDGGEFTFTYEFSALEKDRLDGLRDAVTEKQFKVTLEMGATDWTETVMGYVTANKVNDVTADEIMSATATITLSGNVVV